MSNLTRLAAICALISGSILEALADDPSQPTGPTPKVEQDDVLYLWIVNKNSGKYLTVSANRTDNGAPVVQSGKAGPASLWSLVKVNDGYHYVTNKNSKKRLDIGGLYHKIPGGLVEQHEQASHIQDFDQWKLIADGQGYFRFVNRGSGMSLGVLSASVEECQPAVQWPANESSDQVWQLVVAAIGEGPKAIPLVPEAGSELPELPPTSVTLDPFTQPTTKPASPKKDSDAKAPKHE